jgi:hypothetical protein
MPLATLDVLVAGPPDPYVDAALSSIPLVNFWMEKSLPEQIPPGTDLVITHGSVVPSTPLEVPTVLINPQSSGFWGERGQETDAGPLSSAETKSALTLHAGLGNVLVDRSSAWKPAPGAEVLAASLSSPLIFGNWDRNPRWLVVGFDLKDSDLPLRTAFPVFLGNLLQALRDGGELEKAAAILPGVTESRLVPLVTEAGSEESRAAPGLSLPGWWLVLLLALMILVAEWFTYTRRITD